MEQGNLRLLTNGQTVFDRYRLKMLVGRGAMGVVWRAEDVELNIDIALKFLAEEFVFDAAAIADLKRETRRGMGLAHPHVVRIFGFFQGGDYAAIAMEYVEGNPLASLQSARREPFFDCEEISEWVRQLCSALEYAHAEAHLVHRDLKPGNLMIDARGRLKVADFGIAAELDAARTRVTTSTDTRGTLSYMSPQQLLGQRVGVDHDIYSLGATLYDLLTGRPPFFSGDVSLQVRTVVPPPLAQRRAENGFSGRVIPDDWERTIAACLAKDASRRPPNAAAVAEMLGLGPLGFATRSPLDRAASSGANAPGSGASPVPAPRANPSSAGVVAAPTVIRAAAATQNRIRTAERAEPAPVVVASPVDLLRDTNAIRKPAMLLAGTATVLGAIVIVVTVGVYWGVKLAREPRPADGQAIPPPIESTREPAARVPTPGVSSSKSDPTKMGAPPPPRAMKGPDGQLRPPPFGIPPHFTPPAEPKPVLDRPAIEHPFVLAASGIEMVWIPPGNNAVGVPARAEGLPANEYPLTDVFLSEGFWLGKLEVSRGQFANVMGFNPSLFHLSADYPVSNVSWNEAMQFCERLTASEHTAGRVPDGCEYTLPSEAQWEYAAKSGFVGRFGVHDSLDRAAWGAAANLEWPQPRGKLEPNGWGLHDMFGNVSEWCRDWYADRRPGGRVDDYTGPPGGTQRVYKGGSFADNEFMMRASVRHGLAPDQRDPRVGFRLALGRRGGDK